MVSIRGKVAPTGGSNMETVTGNWWLLSWQFQLNTTKHWLSYYNMRYWCMCCVCVNWIEVGMYCIYKHTNWMCAHTSLIARISHTIVHAYTRAKCEHNMICHIMHVTWCRSVSLSLSLSFPLSLSPSHSLSSLSIPLLSPSLSFCLSLFLSLSLSFLLPISLTLILRQSSWGS